MLLSLVITGTALLGGGAGPGPAFHAFGAVNDSLSHGQIGDNFLSLNEAIRLHNGTLLSTQLSAAELGQLQLIPGTGSSTLLSWVRLDASVTPVITIEQDLDVIVNTTYGLFLSCDNGQTVLDFSGANIQFGMRSTSNALQMRDLVFSGGPGGLDVVQTDISGQIGLAINDCRFENQSQFGVRVVSNTANGFGKIYLEHCAFDGCLNGVTWNETPAGRTSFFDLHDCRFVNVTAGVNLQLGAGGTGRYTFDRIVIDALLSGIDLQRAVGSDRPALVSMRHVEVRAPDCVDFDCTATAATTVSMQMLHLWTTTTGFSLRLGAVYDDLGGVIEDSTFDGNLSIGSGGGSAPLTVQNVRSRNGQALLATDAAQSIAVLDSRFDGSTTQVNGNAPIAFDNCCFVGGSLSGTSTSQVVCADSYVGVGGQHVTINTPRPAENLGGMHVLPALPALGTTVTFQADLPTGLWGAFLLGFTDAFPPLPWPQPLHVYGQLNNTWLLSGTFRNQQTYLWPVPNVWWLVGLDVTAQIAVLPDPGVSALPVQLAPGRRFVLR